MEGFYFFLTLFTYETAEPDVFIGGDVYTGQKFCIDAIAAGKQGAVSLNRAVREGHSLILGRDRRDYKAIDKDNIVLEPGSYDNTPRQNPGKIAENRLTFKDERLALTEEQVKKETARCLSCGAAHVDQNLCFGCALCTTRCKFDAITVKKVTEVWGVPYEQIIPEVGKELFKKGGRVVRRKLHEIQGNK